MIRTVKELKDALSNLDDDDFIYAVDSNRNALDILYIDDSTSIGFWELSRIIQ